MEKFSKYSLIAGFGILGVLLIGLFVSFVLVKQPQNIKSKAFDSGLTLNMINPRSNSRILGGVIVKASVKTDQDIKSMTAVMKMGSVDQTLNIQRIDSETILLTGNLDTSKFTPGNYTLEMLLYSTATQPLSVLADTTVSVVVVSP